MKRPTLAVLIGCTALAACARGEGLRPGTPGPRPPRHVAALPLRAETASLTAELERAGSEALETALPIDPAFHELLLLPTDAPSAVAYRLELEAGERVEVEVLADSGAVAAAVDVFEHLGGLVYRYAQARRTGEPFAFEPVVAGTYLLRVRPDSAGGRYRVSVRGAAPAVLFPVANADVTAIRSGWGTDRDAGIRSHEGVDIFAPRHTPVLSVAESIVERVETTRSGGRVVWAKDVARELTYYYAHLETQRVKRGARLAAGDTVGTVGNSGNAKGASPHLHFGVYRPGWVATNPMPLLGRGTGELLVLPADADVVLGSTAETRGSGVRLRAGPGEHLPIVAELAPGTPLRVTGVLGEWRRVALADGRTGFIAGWLLQPVGASPPQ